MLLYYKNAILINCNSFVVLGRGGRVVERGALEMRYSSNVIVGSNPTLSVENHAKTKFANLIKYRLLINCFRSFEQGEYQQQILYGKAISNQIELN